jgi:hypothetical protein
LIEGALNNLFRSPKRAAGIRNAPYESTSLTSFDNMAYQFGALLKIDKGKWSGSMAIKYMGPSGDFFVVEVQQGEMDRD